MLSRKPMIEGRTPFSAETDIFDAVEGQDIAQLAMAAGDIVLVVDSSGRILDGSADPEAFPDLEKWIGGDWFETVTIESRPKLMEMLAAARKGDPQRWRQVNHPGSGGDIAVDYLLLPLGEHQLAIGRDLRDIARMQQRLLQVQQSLERDYVRLRQYQSRYRMLFDLGSEPMMLVEAESHRIAEANPAAQQMFGGAAARLVGTRLPGLIGKADRAALGEHLATAMVSDHVDPVRLSLGGTDKNVELLATGFSQQGERYLLVRLSDEHGDERHDPHHILDLVDDLPDGFIVTDSSLQIVHANRAFIEMIQAASLAQLRGRPIGDFIGRPGIDLDLIQAQLAAEGALTNVSTVLRARGNDQGEAAELSAVRTGGDAAHTAFIVRPVGRRLRDLPPSVDDLPRSVDQLTDLVGRMSLKEIVRESTDLIERLCIEAALSYTSDNRASAAEILGLSRQSLYSKLRRYKIGNLPNEGE